MKANNEKKNWEVGNYYTHPSDPYISGECCLINMSESEVRKYMKTARFQFLRNFAQEITNNKSYVVIGCEDIWSNDKGLYRKLRRHVYSR